MIVDGIGDGHRFVVGTFGFLVLSGAGLVLPDIAEQGHHQLLLSGFAGQPEGGFVPFQGLVVPGQTVEGAGHILSGAGRGVLVAQGQRIAVAAFRLFQALVEFPQVVVEDGEVVANGYREKGWDAFGGFKGFQGQ